MFSSPHYLDSCLDEWGFAYEKENNLVYRVYEDRPGKSAWISRGKATLLLFWKSSKSRIGSISLMTEMFISMRMVKVLILARLLLVLASWFRPQDNDFDLVVTTEGTQSRQTGGRKDSGLSNTAHCVLQRVWRSPHTPVLFILLNRTYSLATTKPHWENSSQGSCDFVVAQ